MKKELFDLDMELVEDSGSNSDPIDFLPYATNAQMFYCNCPKCGAEINIDILDPTEYETNDVWCSCTNHFKVEFLPGLNGFTDKILIKQI